MNPRELIRAAALRFRNAGIPDPENDAALLLSHLTGRPPLELRLDMDTLLDASVLSGFEELALKRLDRIPLQYLVGKAPFYHRSFLVDSRVLIPRPETELLCEWALELIKGRPSPRILDLCCGSGCIGLTLKAEYPDAQVTLSDISADALAVASQNAEALSLDVVLHRGDLLKGFPECSFDLILSNPPYIPAGDCDSLQPEVLREPRLALDGGMDGCDVYRRIADGARSVLAPGGQLLMELGIDEAEQVSSLLSTCGYTGIRIKNDYAGIQRMILAARP